MPSIWKRQEEGNLVLDKAKEKPLQKECRKKKQMLNCNLVSCGVFLTPADSSKSRELLTLCRSSGTPGWLSRVSLNLSMSSLEKH